MRIDTPTIIDFSSAEHGHDNPIAGGTLGLPVGQDGEDGQDGIPGVAGVAGAAGATGATGAAGAVGPMGPPGNDGEDMDNFPLLLPGFTPAVATSSLKMSQVLTRVFLHG
jgi:hypothetical protein